MCLFQSTEIGRKKKKPLASNGTAGKPKRTVLIIDDHIIVRQGLKQLINREEDLLACGEVEDARKGLEAIRVLKPEVVLVDISLPGMNGMEFIKNAKASYPGLRVVVYSMHDESLYAERVLRAGVDTRLGGAYPREDVATTKWRFTSCTTFVPRGRANPRIAGR